VCNGRCILALAGLSLLAGCTQYQPLPLSGDTVKQRLSPPEWAAISVQASAIKHPILRPVKLDPAAGLSPDGAAVLAVLLNPALRAVRDQRALADAQILQAGLLPDPEMSSTFEVPAGGDTVGAANAFGLELSWDVASLIAHSAKVKEAETHREAIELDIAWQEWQVAQAAKSAAYRLAGLGSQIVVAEEIERRSTENLDLVRKAVAAGTRTARDLSTAEAASQQACEALTDLEKRSDQQRLQFNRLLGLPPEAGVRLKDGIELPFRFDLPTAQELIEGLEQRRLDLVALRAGYGSQEAAVRAAILDQFPKISIGPTIGRDIENVNAAGLALTVDLPVFNRNQGRIDVEQATRQRLFDEYVNRVFEARSDVEMILSRIRFLNQQIAAAQAAESDLQRLVETYRAALASGRVDALTYYAAWNDLATNRMRTLVLRMQLAEAIVALELAAGMYEIPRPNKA